MYKNYIFDFYGTLVDIHTDEDNIVLWEKTADFFRNHGADIETTELRDKYFEFVEEEKQNVRRRHPDYEHIDIQIDKVFRKIYALKNIDADDELLDETGCYYRRASREYICLYRGIRELLDDIKANGGRIYLLTNAQRAFTWDEIDTVGLRNVFDGIIISSDEECSKPDIHFFKILMERYDIDPKESIMVGNDPMCDISGGIKAGLDTLYIHTNISPELDENTGCTYFIPDGNTLKMRDYLL